MEDKSKFWKILFFAALAVILVGAGFVIARAIAQDEDPQVVEIPISIIIRAPGHFTVTVTPINAETGDVETEVTKGAPAVFTIHTEAVDGYDGKILFEFAGLPEGSVFEFSANDIAPGTDITLTVQTGNLTSNSVYVCSLSAYPN